MIKSKRQMFAVIGVFALVLMLGTVTYAFFNYTRTGTANMVSTGRISFTSSQSGTFNLTNVFPITRTEAATDNINSSEVIISITGDTAYTDGIEYLVTVEDVSIETSTHKKVPIGIAITPEKTGELGTANDNYFNNNVRGGNTSYYKVLGSSVLKDGDYILVGYIRPGVAEVNGTIGIRAFIDKDKILISDTYDGTESDNMGTPSSMATGKTVLTTTEWNALQGNNAISFKVKIQANEGVWVGEPLSRNDMKAFPTEITSIKTSLTEINFIRMSEEMINTHNNLIDLTADGGQGVVKAWIDNSKLYIASPGETYFPQNSTALFQGFSNVESIVFRNINTTATTNMTAMFFDDSSLISLDMSGFDVNNVQQMPYLFKNCSGLTNINLDGFNPSSAINIDQMFYGCSNLTSLDLSGFNTSYAQSMNLMFYNCSSLTNINFGNLDVSSVSDMQMMFAGCSSLTNLDLSGFNSASVTTVEFMFQNCSSLVTLNISGLGSNSLSNIGGIFNGCTNLREINMSGFNFGTVSSLSSKFSPLTNLEVIDLSNVVMNNVTDISGAFANDTNLTTIYVSNTWDVSNVSNSSGMFYNCTSLVGGAETHFDSTYPIDKTYARIDGGPNSETPGYLTLKTN